jgi:hypothetical protein
MSFDGGFGAAVYIREDLINTVLKTMHFNHGDIFRVALSDTLSLDGVLVTLSGGFYVELPKVMLSAADGKARVALSGVARLRVQSSDTDESCIVRLTAILLVPFVLDDVGPSWNDQVFLDLSKFDIVSATVAVPWISALPGIHAPALATSAAFRQMLLDAIRPMAQKHLRINVPVRMIDQMELNLLASATVVLPTIRPAMIRVMDGALAVGFNLLEGGLPTTIGDPNTFEQPWNQWAAGLNAEDASIGSDIPTQPEEVQIVVAIQPAMFLKFGGPNLSLQLRIRSIGKLGDDKRIDDVTLNLVPNAATLLINITDINDDPFPDGHIRLLVTVIPFATEIYILSTDVVFKTGGLLGLIDDLTGLITDYVRALAKDAIGGSVREANWVFAMAKFAGDLPDAAGEPGNARVRVTHRGTALDPSYVLTGIAAEVIPVNTQPDDSDPRDGAVIDNPDVLPRAEVIEAASNGHGRVPIRSRTIRFGVAAHPTFRRDPTLRTFWSVRIEHQDRTVDEFSQDRWSDDPFALTLDIDLWSEKFYFADQLDVRCVHYRPPDGPVPELTSEPIVLKIADRFRRDFPFVRWHRDIAWITTSVDGTQTVNSKRRLSAIHKTDIRQRCEFCDTGDNRPIGPSGMQNISVLPAIPEQDFRVKLCDFCFRESAPH